MAQHLQVELIRDVSAVLYRKDGTIRRDYTLGRGEKGTLDTSNGVLTIHGRYGRSIAFVTNDDYQPMEAT